MSKLFKPMLASPADLDAVRYPIYGSPKLDGIRAANVEGRLLSRTLKEIPSRHVYNIFNQHKFAGLDGELIVGAPTHHECYRNTVSNVMADNKTFDFTYFVFDMWDKPHLSFSSRREKLISLVAELDHKHIKQVEHTLLFGRDQLDAYEAAQVAAGYEGIMLADPNALYKFGRATTKGGELLKVKRFVDSEAVVIGVEEEMFNGNEAETNELGRTKRSTAKDGLVGKGSMGALTVRDVKSGVEFNIGTGFTAEDRAEWWQWALKNGGRLICKELSTQRVIKYKSFPIGVKDKPRHPVYLGLRPAGA